MFTSIGMINLTMVVNSTNIVKFDRDLRIMICDFDRFNTKSVKLIDDKVLIK